MKPLSEVAPGLLVIKIQIQAVCVVVIKNNLLTITTIVYGAVVTFSDVG